MREEIWEFEKDKRNDVLIANTQAFLDAMDRDPSITDGFLRHNAELFKMLADQQGAGLKGSLRYITMSFLQSGVVAETYELATACHTADLYMDETETETYWQMGFLRDMVNRDMERIVPRLHREIFQIRDYEIEEFRFHHAMNYLALLLPFFSQVVHRVFALPAFLAVQKEEQVDVTFGSYMEEAFTLARYNQEGA